MPTKMFIPVLFRTGAVIVIPRSRCFVNSVYIFYPGDKFPFDENCCRQLCSPGNTGHLVGLSSTEMVPPPGRKYIQKQPVSFSYHQSEGATYHTKTWSSHTMNMNLDNIVWRVFSCPSVCCDDRSGLDGQRYLRLELTCLLQLR